MAENREIRQSLCNQQIGSWGWFPVSDTSETQRFGRIEELKNYGNYNVWKITFEDKSCAFLSDKNLEEKTKTTKIRRSR